MANTEDFEINGKVNVDTGDAEGKFQRLQTQIRETQRALQEAAASGDTVKFAQLKSQLDDLEDRLEITTIKSKKFGDALAAAPGPIGQAGAAVKAFDGALKFLAANPIIGVIAAIVAAFFAMKKALEQTAEGQAVLSEATTAFNNVLAPLLKLVTAVAIPVFKALGSILNGLAGVYADLTGKSKEYQQTLADQALAAQAEQILKKQKQTVELIGATFTETGKKSAAARIQYLEDIDKINKAENLSIAQKQDYRVKRFKAFEAELAKIRKEANLKEAQEAEKRIEARGDLNEAILEENKQLELLATNDANKRLAIEVAYAKKIYEVRSADINQRMKLYSQDSDEYIKLLAEKHKLDTAYYAQVNDLAQKEVELRKKALDQELKDAKAAFDVRARVTAEYVAGERAELARRRKDGLETEQTYQAQLIELQQIADENKIKDAQGYYDTQKALLNNALSANVINQEEYNIKIKELDADLAKSKTEVATASFDRVAELLKLEQDLRDKAAEDEVKRQEIIREAYKNTGDRIASVFSSLSTIFSENEKLSKTFATISVVISSAAAIADVIMKSAASIAAFREAQAKGVAAIASGTTLLTNPITAAVGAAQIAAGKAAVGVATAGIAATKITRVVDIAAITAAAAAQIAQINAKKPSATGASAGGGGGTTTIGLGPTIGAPQVGAGAFNQQGVLAGIVAGSIAANQSTGQPIRAYVVGNDITTEQQLQRRIRTAARLGG